MLSSFKERLELSLVPYTAETKQNNIMAGLVNQNCVFSRLLMSVSNTYWWKCRIGDYVVLFPGKLWISAGAQTPSEDRSV